MKRNVGYIYLCTVMISGSLHAFIYEIILLKRINPTTGRPQQFIGLSDFHDKKNGANAAQLTCIKDFFNKQKKDRTKIILEDLSTDAGNGSSGSCKQFQIDSRGGILGGLARICHKDGFQVDNIEYRYCRVAALGPLFNNAQQKVHAFPSACGIRVCDIVDEIHNAMSDIGKRTNCCASLKAYQQKTLKKIEPQMNRLNLIKESKHSMADYVQQNGEESNRHDVLKKLLIFDSALLDLKLAHSILTADECDTIIAISGGSHIARVKEILRSAGYRYAYSKPKKHTRAPKPLDLTLLPNLYSGSL